MGSSFVAIEENPSPAVSEYIKRLSGPAENANKEFIFAGFVLSAAIFTITAMSLYHRVNTSGAVVILGVGFIMMMEGWINITGMTPTEKCLVFLPWVMSMGMSGVVIFSRSASLPVEVLSLAVLEKQPA